MGGSLRRRPGQSRYSHRARHACSTGPATAVRSVLRFLNRRCGGSWKPCSTALCANDWHYLVRLLAREARQPGGLLSHRLAVGNLQLLLIQGLLQIQPHNYTQALTESESPASPAVAKRAIDLMHAHPETPWSTAERAP